MWETETGVKKQTVKQYYSFELLMKKVVVGKVQKFLIHKNELKAFVILHLHIYTVVSFDLLI